MINTKPCGNLADTLKICKQCSGNDQCSIQFNAFWDRQHVGALDCSVSGKHVHIHVLYVKPAFRELGIAKALLNFLQADLPGMEVSCAHAVKPASHH
ncbi:GNAT family N-acetyltransferase [Undibacterium sp. Ji50W]|uniref:GNAT family N-acetyltransferase n=1 Tax=Undibacterium sp. Ji50W TaxID=3413041 RepID=UPI003BF1E3E0